MKKILFIEDESALQKAMGELLRPDGYEIISALNGEEGVHLAQAKNPDLIVLDLILPKLHGFEVLKKLKENKKTQDIPVIVLTNLEATQDVEKAIKMGATVYLVKSSYNLEEVTEKIKSIFNK
ncbi:MAG: response regulator [Candidatus Nealsonbacteria bacterium]|nr:response regulator [Candidatus Nealsonbacteria bacterium]